MAIVFAPTSTCLACTDVIRIDSSSSTGASPTNPIEIFSTFDPQPFRLCVRNKGNCTLFVYVRRNNQPFQLSSNSIAIMDQSGNMIASAKPFQEERKCPPSRNFDFIEECCLEELGFNVTHIAILCVPTDPNVCPLCDVEICLTLVCGEQLFYSIQPPVPVNLRHTPITISGKVQCLPPENDNQPVLNPLAYFAQLITCPIRAGGESKVIAKTTLFGIDDQTASFEFKDVKDSKLCCFRVEIVCISSGAVQGSSRCQLTLSPMTVIESPILIDCTTCPARVTSIIGQVVCTSGAATLVVPSLMQCNPGTANCFNATGGTGSTGSCGSALSDVLATTTVDPNGNFRFDNVAEGCYQIQFRCANPLSILATIPCALYCSRAVTNVGTTTIATCNCTSPTVNLGGTISCSSSTITVASGTLSAQLLTCNTACDTPSTTVAQTSTITLSSTGGTGGTFSFSGTAAGCYAVRIIHTGTTGNTTTIGTLGCKTYSANATLTNIPIDCTALITASTLSTASIASVAAKKGNDKIMYKSLIENDIDMENNEDDMVVSVIPRKMNQQLLTTSKSFINQVKVKNVQAQPTTFTLRGSLECASLLKYANLANLLLIAVHYPDPYSDSENGESETIIPIDLSNGKFEVKLANPPCYALRIVCKNNQNFLLSGSLEKKLYTASNASHSFDAGKVVNLDKILISSSCLPLVKLQGKVVCNTNNNNNGTGKNDNLLVKIFPYGGGYTESAESKIIELNKDGSFTTEVAPNLYTLQIICKSNDEILYSSENIRIEKNTLIPTIFVKCSCGYVSIEGIFKFKSPKRMNERKIKVIASAANGGGSNSYTAFIQDNGGWNLEVLPGIYKLEFFEIANVKLIHAISADNYSSMTIIQILEN